MANVWDPIVNRNFTVVHIAPHIGGGVGTSLARFINQSEAEGIDNKIFCLDWCDHLNIDFRHRSRLFQGVFWGHIDNLISEIRNCNCVLIHYWNHPLMTVFLSSLRLPKNKSIGWCHNSGLAEPHIIPTYLTDILNRVVFTSESSKLIPNYEKIKAKIGESPSVVPSIRDLQKFISIGNDRQFTSPRPKLLYVGAVSKAKMHVESAHMFAELSKHGLQIDVVGGPDHFNFEKQVEALGGKINVFGHVENVQEFYKNSDLFIYPLRRDHYGTGEQVVREALASGLPVVAFDNPAELAILNQFPKLKLAGSSSDFVAIVMDLIRSPAKLFQLSKEVNQKASLIFASNQMTEDLLRVIKDVSKQDGKEELYEIERVTQQSLIAVYAHSSFFDENIYQTILNHPDRGVEILISAIFSSLANPSQIEKWQVKTKSSPQHYLQYFPENRELSNLTSILRKF